MDLSYVASFSEVSRYFVDFCETVPLNLTQGMPCWSTYNLSKSTKFELCCIESVQAQRLLRLQSYVNTCKSKRTVFLVTCHRQASTLRSQVMCACVIMDVYM